jgi:hypothetical protein
MLIMKYILSLLILLSMVTIANAQRVIVYPTPMLITTPTDAVPITAPVNVVAVPTVGPLRTWWRNRSQVIVTDVVVPTTTIVRTRTRVLYY